MLRQNKQHKDHWLLDITCLAGIFLLFYTFWLGGYPLFTPDEGRYSEVAREMVASGDFITPRVNGVAFLDKPVLYYWLQAIAIELFGVKEWALRLFPALLGILSCIITYICGRRLFNRKTGLLSAIILATSPLYFGLAHYANLDLEVAALISSTLLCFITGITSQDKSRPYFLFAAYFFAGLAFLTKGLIGFAFPTMIAGSWILLLKRWDVFKKAHFIKGMILAIAIALPWYILVQRDNPQFLHFFFVTQQVTRFLSAGTFNNPTPIWFYAPIVLIGFFPWTIFLVQALFFHLRQVWTNKQNHQAELYLLLWLGIIFIFFSIPHSKMIGYILPIFPALALLVGNYLATNWENKNKYSLLFATISFCVLSTLLAAFVFASQQYKLIEMSKTAKPYFYLITAIFSLSAITSFILLFNRKFSTLVTTCVITNVIFLSTLVLTATHLNTTSAKQVVMDLKTIIKPQDEVIHFYKFFQDVPVYLERRVSIVANWTAPDIAQNDNWVRELWFGMPFQNTEEWLINKDKFVERWNGDNRVFVFISSNYMAVFKKYVDHYFIISKHHHIYLISNKATYLSFLTPKAWAKCKKGHANPSLKQFAMREIKSSPQSLLGYPIPQN